MSRNRLDRVFLKALERGPARRESLQSFVVIPAGNLLLSLLLLILAGTAGTLQRAAAQQPSPPVVAPDVLPTKIITDDERTAIAITAYDLDVHLTPAQATEDVLATLTIRNISTHPVARIPLQISGTLRWQTISGSGHAVPFTQFPVGTDMDHTGFAQEAVVTPSAPLAPGATLVLSTLYAGQIKQSNERLTLAGVDAERAAQIDWDAIQPTTEETSTALRGFGQVLWYPVAEPLAALGDGNKVFALVGRVRRQQAVTTMRLRLAVEYVGDPPNGAIFNGRLQPLHRLTDDDATLVDETRGVAQAEWPAAPLGLRSPSLFLTAQNAANTPDQLLSVVTPVPEAAEPYAAAAVRIAPLLEAWLSPGNPVPVRPLLLLDRPGAPFEDGKFIAAHLVPGAEPEAIAPQLVRGLTDAWMPELGPANAWLNQGLADLMSLLWAEKSAGRAGVLAQLQQAAQLLALAEPDLTATPGATGEPLTAAFSDIYLDFKSASVLWQLRELVGEPALKQALAGLRKTVLLHASVGDDPKAFQVELEKASGRDLGWFFDDWVYRDRGLPDLTIAHVLARPATGATHDTGFLVAVEVRNDGDAVADVPVTVHAADGVATERLRIAAHASGSVRIIVQDRPQTVEVNDGSVPELRSERHSAAVPQ